MPTPRMVCVSVNHPLSQVQCACTGGNLMESISDTKLGGLQNTFSRRNLLKGATALTAAASVPQAIGQQPTGAPFGTVWLYIGTYTGNPASIYGRGKGIYLCELNLLSG